MSNVAQLETPAPGRAPVSAAPKKVDPNKPKEQAGGFKGAYIALGFVVLILVAGLILLILWLTGVIWKSKGTTTDTQSATTGGGGGGGGRAGTSTDTGTHTAPHGLVWLGSAAWAGELGVPMVTVGPKVQGTGPIKFSVIPALPAGLAINANTGVISGTPTEPLPSTVYTLRATNAYGEARLAASLQIPDHEPDMGYPNLVQGVRMLKAGQAYSFAPASAVQGEPVPVSSTWSVSPAFDAGLGLSLDPKTGVISGTAGAAAQAGKAYTVTVTNATGAQSQIALNLGVALAPAAPTTAAFIHANPTYDINAMITPNMLQFSDSVEAVEIKSGTLPAGLKFDRTTGDIIGTPTALTPAPVAVVVDLLVGGAAVASATVTITVANAAPVFAVPDAWPMVLEVGVPIEPLVPAVTAGTSIAWSVSGDLPAGLAVDPASGSITGTPANTEHPRSTNFTLNATNSLGSDSEVVHVTLIDSSTWTLRLRGYTAEMIDPISDFVSAYDGKVLGITAQEMRQALTAGLGKEYAEIKTYKDLATAEQALQLARMAGQALPGLEFDVIVTHAAPLFTYPDLNCAGNVGGSVSPQQAQPTDPQAREYEFVTDQKVPEYVVIYPDTGEVEVQSGQAPVSVTLKVAAWNLGGRVEVPINIVVT